jgi:hypothetical protein
VINYHGLSVHLVTCAILHLFMILQKIGPFVILMFLCPGINALQNEQAFPDISFNVFSSFIAQNFGSKITLATMLMLLFSTIENPDLLNLH